MNGSYNIRIRSKVINYDLVVKRKITIIRGDSATGKTRLTTILREIESRRDSRYNLYCDVRCEVLAGRRWEQAIREDSGFIFFIDEEEPFLETYEFAKTVKESDNYFVIITRFDLRMLPYSVNEIYELRYSGKYTRLDGLSLNTGTAMYYDAAESFYPTALITEDEKSGYTFFKDVCLKNSDLVFSGKGNSNVRLLLDRLEDEKILLNENILICVDGASFGPYILDLYEYTEKSGKNNYYILAYESFEHLLLSSEMFMQDADLKEKILNPELYITNKQFSWENYYTDLLRSATRGTLANYRKDRLNICYRENCCVKKSECKYCSYGNKRDIILGKYADKLIFDK